MWRQRNKFEEVKFIFPNAPTIPITVNGGMRMPGWYDIQDFGDIANRSEDESGILKSRDTIWGLIKAEVDKGIPAERVVVGGFSQGGAMAVLSGLTYSNRLGGIFGLSCYMLLSKKFESLVPADNPNKDTPVFMGHGGSDPLVRHQWAVATADKLKGWGYSVDLHTYKYVFIQSTSALAASAAADIDRRAGVWSTRPPQRRLMT